jgi:ferredoxin/flavodoxin---NADP+ reductase
VAMFIEEAQKMSSENLGTQEPVKNSHKILDVRFLTEHAFVIRLEKKNIEFIAGQHVHLKIPGNNRYREYSIYSGEKAPFIEVLVKEVVDGYLTPVLKKTHSGQHLELFGPMGSYQLRPKDIGSRKYLFIASGTGISPFHSFVSSYQNLNYTILHGVRFINEAYERSFYSENHIVTCTTGDFEGDFHGRVTDYLETKEIDKDFLIYLCGNYNMIVDSIEILKSKGFSRDQIFVESYF